MLVFVSSQLVLMRLMGRLLPDVGSGDLNRIVPVIGLVLGVLRFKKSPNSGKTRCWQVRPCRSASPFGETCSSGCSESSLVHSKRCRLGISPIDSRRMQTG